MEEKNQQTEGAKPETDLKDSNSVLNIQREENKNSVIKLENCIYKFFYKGKFMEISNLISFNICTHFCI